jgi:hypothetical protein
MKNEKEQNTNYSCNSKNIELVNFVWYLNLVNEGGELLFLNNGSKIIPETGKLILFPSTWCFPYSISNPVSNDKYVIYGSIEQIHR